MRTLMTEGGEQQQLSKAIQHTLSAQASTPSTPHKHRATFQPWKVSATDDLPPAICMTTGDYLKKVKTALLCPTVPHGALLCPLLLSR